MDESPATSPVAPPPAQPLDDAHLADALARRGVPVEEISKLLALRKPTLDPTDPRKPPVERAAPPPPPEPFVPKSTLVFPSLRDASPEQSEAADKLLLQANIARRRGQFAEAERLCTQAIEQTPGDASALEILGDVLQALGRVDDALAAYERSTEAAPGRASAERKYAALMLLQQPGYSLPVDVELPRNPYLAVLLSSVFPGAGQVYNGDYTKGVVMIAVTVMCLILLLFTRMGIHGAALSNSAVALMIVILALYVTGLIDANVTARRGRRKASGWEV